jgi:single-strand DNA-binding protein
MASYNRVTFLGNLTRTPELKYAKSGTAICEFGLAMNDKYGDKETTCFIDVTCFGRQAETASEYLEKGRQALIEGRLTFESWEGQDGQKRSKHKVVADRVVFVGGKGGESGAAGGGSGKSAAPVVDDDDVPFVTCELEDGLSLSERHKFMA